MDNKSILVAVDFGSTSARAFSAAVDLAARLEAPLDIITVVPPVPIEAVQTADAPYAAVAQSDLAELASIAEARGVRTRTHLRGEAVVFALLEAIEELEPQFVVVGSHGRHGVARVLLGSISESLARRSKVPVIIVPSPERHEAAAAAAWSCSACGHILGDSEPRLGCSRCGATPARWLSAAMPAGAADAGEPTIGEAVANDLESVQTGSGGGGGGGFFATAPAGGNNRTETNAELRVRY